MNGLKQHLGDLLVSAGLVTSSQLQTALDVQKTSGLRLGAVLVGLGYVTETEVAMTLAQQLRLPFIPDHELQVDFALARLIPVQVARQKLALPVAERFGHLTIAMADPLDVFTQDEMRHLTGKPIDTLVATPTALEQVISQYERLESLTRSDLAVPEALRTPDETTTPDVDDAPVVQLVNELIDRALSERASDIHIEPGELTFRVRFRVDGFLREIMRPQATYHSGVIARIKVMAGLDIAERRAPQDGRVELRDRGRNVDLRVSLLPTIYGEKCVIRIFNKSRAVVALADLGMAPELLVAYTEAITRPHGMVLVTGPTGSGKTTTLTSTLAYINTPDHNIITIEDPVEYQLPGVNHCQVNARAGLTFVGGLRSILRQDPDVIMVGEIRDAETAELAVRSALTGHLVLSTLHTGSAAGSLTRLLDMGVEAYLISASIHGVLAQRLVRRLCTHCCQPGQLDVEALVKASVDVPVNGTEVRVSVGCSRCQGTGYLGRLPIFEFLAMTPEIRDLINHRAPEQEVLSVARRAQMRSLLVDGMDKVYQGLTAVAEVFRVANPEHTFQEG